MKFAIFTTLVASVVASYGSSSGRSGGYSSGGGGGGSSGYSGQVVPAAIQTRHQISYREVPTTSDIHPATVEVGAGQIPITILFKSASSNLNIRQVHDGAQGSTQESESEDEPHVLKHQVTKPIIQEVREIITPSRKIEIQPVQEEILTLVAKGDQQRNLGGGGGGSGGSGLAGGSSGLSGGALSGLGGISIGGGSGGSGGKSEKGGY
ncbi:hypothetical protein TYRP_021997 [Tyrophagus putrescentiae]|nr:hypothetical protein TYRP_021997 [Tyrophagus putrescentiae]